MSFMEPTDRQGVTEYHWPVEQNQSLHSLAGIDPVLVQSFRVLSLIHISEPTRPY